MINKFKIILLFILFAGTHSLPAQNQNNLLLLEKQINSFNEQELHTLVENVTGDFKWFYVTEDTLIEEVNGRDAFKKAMESYFQYYGDTKTSISGITQSGDFISFKETVSWNMGQKNQSSVAVYQFENNKIKRAWYFPTQEENIQPVSNHKIMELTKNEIRIERLFPVPLTTLWKAWTDDEQVGSWFALKAHVVPERGGAYELFWRPDEPERDSTIGCRITLIKPEQYLGFTWRGPHELSNIMNEGNPPPSPTHVTVVFSEHKNGSGIQVLHEGFGESAEWQTALKWHEVAWSRVLDNLEAFLDDQPLPYPWN